MKKRVLAIILLVALVLSAFAPAATAIAPPNRLEQAMQAVAQATQGVMQAQGLGIQPLSTDFVWSSENEVVVAPGTPHVDVIFHFAGPAGEAKQVTQMDIVTTSTNDANPVTLPASPAAPTIVGQTGWAAAPIQFRQFPHQTVLMWDHGAFGGPITGSITVRVLLPADAPVGTVGTVSTTHRPEGNQNNWILTNTPIPVVHSTTTIVIGHSRTITLNAGDGGTFEGVTLPEGWTAATDYSSITRTALQGTAWDTIDFPEPVRVNPEDGHARNGWNPERPTGDVGTEDFTSTALWRAPGPNRTITLNAGIGGTFNGITLPEGWSRSANGMQLTRTVANGTAWSTIDFPEPVRVNPADDFDFDGWDPAQPTTGGVEADFESTAQWDRDGFHMIVLDAGDGGTYATEPTAWTRGADNSYIWCAVATGTAWADIDFPEPVRVDVTDGYEFDGWLPAQPATGNITANFESTAQWDDDPEPGETRLVTLNAGIGGTWPTTVEGWERSEDGMQITRTVDLGAPWASITFPTPIRQNPADGFTLVAAPGTWNPVQPTANVTDDFASTAQWEREGFHLIVLDAGDGGTYATAPTGWTRGADNSYIWSAVATGTPWADIDFPEPVRVDVTDGYVFVSWLPAQPETGNITANFESTAQWDEDPYGDTRTIRLHADGGTFEGVTLPEGWTRATDNSYITLTVDVGTPWDTITFPEPTHEDYDFDGWDPAHPETGNITANFESTAQWDDEGNGETRLITLNAGIGGTWPATVEGWERSANGVQITRTVPVGTPWASITFPEPVRLVPADGLVLVAAPDTWNPVQPTGNVEENFTSTARWTPDGENNHLIALHAGIGGMFNAPAPAGWTRAADGSYIFRVVPTGTAWDTIQFTLPVRAVTDAFVFNTWDEARPTGVVDADFEATAQWRSEPNGATHTITLRAGTGGTFPTDVPAEWTRSADGTVVTRTVTAGTAWNLIDFPLPVRLAPEGFVRAGWTLDRPTGTVVEDFDSTALWTPPAPYVEIVLYAGDGGTWPTTAPTAPIEWIRAANGSYIAGLVESGTAWNTIEFPEPVATDDDDFDGWLPTQPTTGNITARFVSTAQWDGNGGGGDTHTITLYADGGTFEDVTIPAEWTRAADDSYIYRTVLTGTPWAGITFPEPVHEDYDFDGWDPVRPTTGNITADFESTAQWDDDGNGGNHLITLNAGNGGIFPTDVPTGWTRSANGMQLTRTVPVGTPWASIIFPLPVRVAEDNIRFNVWLPAQLTGLVNADFTTTAQWMSSPTAETRTITLNAGNGGTFNGVNLPGEWTRSADGLLLTRTVELNTPWNLINFPLPVRVVSTDGFNFDRWLPVQPTGEVTANFTSIAQWINNLGQRPPITVTVTPDRDVTITNRPGGTEVDNYGPDTEGDITVTFPPGTPPVDITVNVPPGWTHTPPTVCLETGEVIVVITPPGPSGDPIIIDVDDDRSVDITNRPDNTVVNGDRPTDTGNITVTFPPGTDRDNIEIGDLPDDWTYVIGQPDADGYITVTFTPPIGTDARIITFNLNGGNIAGSQANVTHTIPAGGSMALDNIPANPVREGQIFMGWLEQEVTTAANAPRFERNAAFVTHINGTTGSRTFVAQWATERTITFDLNGGNINNVTTNVVHTITAAQNVAPNFGIALTDLPANPARTGQFFLGWLETTPEGSQVHWDRSEAFVTYIRNSVGNRVFTAQWSTTRTITFNLNGGNINNNTANVVHSIGIADNLAPTYGIALTNIPANPTRLAYEFVGWLETAPSGNDTRFQRNEAFVTHLRNSIGNRTYTAQWEPTSLPTQHRAFLIGFPDGTMRPQEALTRAEAATIFFRLIDDEFRALPTTWSTSNNFADVQTANWFNNAISTMTRLDVIRGVSATTFAPNRSVTNGEFFAMLARFNRMVDSDTISVATGHWAEVYAVALEEANLITGFSGNAARLDAPITRASVAELVNRAVTERVVENRNDLINTGALRRSWSDLPATSPHYLNMVMAGHTIEYNILDNPTAGDWVAVRWTRIVRHIDWTVLEGPNANPNNILRAIEIQQVETAQIERNAAVEVALDAEPSV